MKVERTFIEDVLILKPSIFEDERGLFYESFNAKELNNNGIKFTPVQENLAFSKIKGTIRGLHFQKSPKAQAKIVRCTSGSVNDFAVDLRKESKTYLKYVMVLLSEKNKLQMFIPKGFAHGVVSLEDNSTIQYWTDEHYDSSLDRAICYNDPIIGINWEIENPLLSDKDRNAPLLGSSDYNF